ncbi:hypothetical protein EDD29_2086 [Actinocorallia herbida]|uniref:Lipoprotein n=1 Tax=Actinocorallia herbida TaxID=58109 RepID=A0A3N1CTB3_9ACTN|nr:hypothetical protein [Actinocorallia herbida]ROO84559.1 hypothetical protein EDD29_2086 [Actinocorallia herbida]
MSRPAPLLLLVALLAAAPACSSGPEPRRTPLSVPAHPASGEPTVSPGATRTVAAGREFTLAPGSSAALSGASLTIAFTGVSADSRCPVDVDCVWAGDATIHLTTSHGPLTLHTLTAASAGPTPLGPYRLTLLSLLPEPHSDTPISPNAYRLRLRLDP